MQIIQKSKKSNRQLPQAHLFSLSSFLSVKGILAVPAKEGYKGLSTVHHGSDRWVAGLPSGLVGVVGRQLYGVDPETFRGQPALTHGSAVCVHACVCLLPCWPLSSLIFLVYAFWVHSECGGASHFHIEGSCPGLPDTSNETLN